MTQSTPQVYNGPNGQPSAEPRVELYLNDELVILAENYQVKTSILTQPAAFSLRLGYGDLAAKNIKDFPPNTLFALLINGISYQTGYIDSVTISGQGTMVNLRGRDTLAALHDAYVEQEFSINNATFSQLVQKCLTDVGLTSAKLAFDNDKNRKAITGGGDTVTKAPRNVQTEQVETDAGGLVKRNVQAKMGERFYEFIKRHLDRAGLFLWAAGDGSFVLSEPNGNQTPLYNLLRSYSGPGFYSNIIDENFTYDTSGRFSSYLVYARGGGRKAGRVPFTGGFADEEMQKLGYTRRFVMKDVNADSPSKAMFMARRKCAEDRRKGFRLSYTVQGHTTPSAASGKAIVWAPDTVVHVDDDKLQIHDNFYVEGVTFNASPQTTTVLDLVRLDDLVFSDSEGAPTTPTQELPSDLAVEAS